MLYVYGLIAFFVLIDTYSDTSAKEVKSRPQMLMSWMSNERELTANSEEIR